MKVYFDSMIWINHAWGLLNETGKVKTENKRLIDFVVAKKIDVVTSAFTNAEIFNHFKDWFLLQKAFADGFSFREFSKVKKKFALEPQEHEQIDGLIRSILELQWVVPMESNGLNPDEMKIFERLTLQHSVDSIDALHAIAAAQANCRYLVSRDESFIDCLNQCLEADELIEEFQVIKPRTFINTEK